MIFYITLVFKRELLLSNFMVYLQSQPNTCLLWWLVISDFTRWVFFISKVVSQLMDFMKKQMHDSLHRILMVSMIIETYRKSLRDVPILDLCVSLFYNFKQVKTISVIPLFKTKVSDLVIVHLYMYVCYPLTHHMNI